MLSGRGQAAGLERGCAERGRKAAGAGAPRLRGACWWRLGPGPRPRGPRCGRSGLAAGSVRAAMAGQPLRRPAWVPLLLRLLLAGITACDASPADDGAGPGGRGPRGRARGDAGADEAVPRHDSSYGTFAGEFYDLRYLSEEGEATRG